MQRCVIGVDIGGTRTKIGLVNLIAGEVIKSFVTPTEKKSSKRFEDYISTAIEDLKSYASSSSSIIVGIGFGVSGFAWENGTVDSTYGFIEFMESYPLGEIINQKFGLPCKVDNDGRTVALGEALYGEGRGYRRMLMLSLGTGVGLGFTQNGELTDRLPYSHMAGHMTITQNEVVCYCGRTGCFESLVSANGIVDAATRAGWKGVDNLSDVESIFTAARLGHPVAKSVVKQWLIHLKTGIDNYVNIFAPDVIVLGGGVAKELKYYLPDVANDNILRPYKNYQVKICISKLEEQAGIMGSAALFLDGVGYAKKYSNEL